MLPGAEELVIFMVTDLSNEPAAPVVSNIIPRHGTFEAKKAIFFHACPMRAALAVIRSQP